MSNNTRKVDEKLTVYGAGFTGFTSAKVDNVDVTNFIVVSDTQITFTVPNPGGSAGLKTITLSNGTNTFTNNNPNNVDDLNIINRNIYVNDNPPTTNNNGNSWSEAYNYLQTALGQSISGDEIWMADGTYKPTTGTDRNESFTLKNGVKIYGGFSGSENLLSSRNFTTNKVILSGDIGTMNDNSDNSYHVVTGVTGATLDGVTISYGNADDTTLNTTSNNGGGMYNLSSSPTLSNIIFSNNSSSNRGGGMYNREYSSPAMTNITFTNNTSGRGGGIYNYTYSSPVMTNITFTNNSAVGSASTGRGGGMTNYDNSAPTMTDIVFSGNTASLRGGGLHNEKLSSPIMTNTIFSSNISSDRGGGIYNDDSSPTLTNVVFSANSATTSGGGMYNYGSSPNVTNTVFANNSSKMGGGIYNISNSSAILHNTTLYGNSASTSGGGIYNYTNSFITLINSIVYGNTSTANNNIYNQINSTLKSEYSDIEGGFSAAISFGTLQDLSGTPITDSTGYTNNGNTDINPNFLNISNIIGTDNMWRTNDDGLNVSSTTPNSVVNGGTTTQSPSTDIVGRTRSGNPDMGAYEYITP